MTKYKELSLTARAVVDGILADREPYPNLKDYRVCDLLASAHTSVHAHESGIHFGLRHERSIRLYDLTIVEMEGSVETNAWLRERWALGERYKSVVGYNPFEDDPTQTNESVAVILAEVEDLIKAEDALNGTD